MRKTSECYKYSLCARPAHALLPLLQVRPSAFAYTIPAASKEPHAPRYAPGPGEYAPPPPRPGPAFTIAPRYAAPAAAGGIPGPGEYEAAEPARAPAFTLAPRPAQPLADAAAAGAGPAEYHLPPAFPGGPAFSVPRARLPEEAAAADPTPGAPTLPLGSGTITTARYCYWVARYSRHSHARYCRHGYLVDLCK